MLICNLYFPVNILYYDITTTVSSIYGWVVCVCGHNIYTSVPVLRLTSFLVYIIIIQCYKWKGKNVYMYSALTSCRNDNAL